jgi:hypothetical protein
VTVTTEVDARRERVGASEALKLANQVDRIIVSRGKKSHTFDMKNAPPDPETLLAHLLGPTGNLRAPALRRGKTLLIGFSAESCGEHLR